MNLLIDVGNTRAKWCLQVEEQLSNFGSVSIDDVNNIELPNHKGVSAAYASCVSSDRVFAQIDAMVQQQYGVSVSRVRVERDCAGIRNGYRALNQLGVDRWVAAIGSRQICTQGPVIIIDAGTAITVDLLSADNEFEGGVILAGSGLMHDALTGRTAGIRSSRTHVDNVVGRTTQECVNAGVYYGLAGAVERIVKEMRKTAKLASVIVCGGDAENLLPMLPFDVMHKPDLIFRGLMVISDQGS